MKKLLTYNTFSSNPKELFKAIETKYFFGKQKRSHTEISPYFMITDGRDILVFDDGSTRACGLSISLAKRPSFWSCRFWSKGPAEFSHIMTKFVASAFVSIVDAPKDSEIIKSVKVIETLSAMYSLDRKNVLPIYVIQLPSDKPLHLNFKLPAKVNVIEIEGYLALAVRGAGQFDTMSSAVSFLISMGDILLPRIRSNEEAK